MTSPTLPQEAARFAFAGVLAAAEDRRRRRDATEPGSATTARVVVGVDDSPASMRAVQWAARLAPMLGTEIEIEVVIVVGFPEWFYDPSGTDASGDARTVAQDVVRSVFGSLPPATVHIAVDDGDPVVRLLAESRDATLMVVGSRMRRDGVEPPDSVGLRVAALATCPVLVVH